MECTHRAIRSWSQLDGSPVQMWSCFYCGLRFDPRIDTKEASNSTEPVAWMDRDGDIYPMPETEGWRPPHTLLYTHPPQRKPLTDEELVDIVGNCASDSGGWFRYHAFARAIERAHGIGGEE